ncbi:hypothetical protein PGT21_001700 [Puccinia graminis f. sp. tritici]|uniref:Uncharacterized protein n=1 Tax=Puccinia graminis f. sp. tritici TaxID=56615 RepID=A0A5B0NT02_PUCGR|nr:hypothetical protein PGT21_001700 [Puccinia graminis f. sp. tritici]
MISSSSTISSLSKTSPTHEPPPVTFADERTPSARLNRAIQSSNINLLKRLLNNNSIDPRNQDPVTRKTTLILATEHANLEICRILIQDYQVDSELISRDLENNTVLHLAAADALDDIITLYHTHHPFVLDWANSDGMTALHVASQKGHESTVSLLLDFQADVELTDNEGNTCLHYAAAWGHLKIVLLLIDRGSPFWAKNNQTFTASDYAFSFSIQSALQESARAHFESKKQQRHQRQHRDRDKDRSQRPTGPAVPTNHNHGPDTAQLIGARPSRLGLKDSHNSSPRSNNTTPQLVSAPMIPKISTSPTTLITAPPPPIVPNTLSPSASSKPLTSPTNSVAAARTVSYLISKDLEAIQDFRTRSTSLANTTNPSNPQQAAPSSASLVPESPTTSSFNSTRLLPLQLVSAAASASSKNSGPSLRPRSSTGNLNNQANPDGNSRTRAGSTDSENGVITSGSGIREGLSRLRYLKSGPSSNASNNPNNNNNNNPSYTSGSPHLSTSTNSTSGTGSGSASGFPSRPAHLPLDAVPGSPGPASSSSSQLPTPTPKLPTSSNNNHSATKVPTPTSNHHSNTKLPTPTKASTSTTGTTSSSSINYFSNFDTS